MRVRKALPWVGLFMVSFAAFAALRIHQDSRSVPQVAMAQPQAPQTEPASRTDPESAPADHAQEFVDDQGVSDAGGREEPADLSELAADDDPSTREEAQALLEALAANPD